MLPGKAGRFVVLPWAEQVLTVEAACWLVAAEGAVRFLPWPWVRWYLDRPGAARGALHVQRAATLQRALRRAVANFPLNTTCLARALAGHALLRRHGVPSAVQLGLQREGGELRAHAWLRCGEDDVVGGAEAAGFVDIGSLARTSP